jgi:hypothetical protein
MRVINLILAARPFCLMQVVEKASSEAARGNGVTDWRRKQARASAARMKRELFE